MTVVSRRGAAADPRSTHEKTRIIGGPRRVTKSWGSYNFSAGAAWNSEDLNVVTSSEVAEVYAADWRAVEQGASG
jgi:hypothetical protein